MRPSIRLLVPCSVILALLQVAGCAARRPDPRADLAAAKAVGLDEAVIFREEGGPTDEPAAGGTLTLGDAVRRAVTTDPRLQAALARVLMAAADADQTRLLLNPVLNVVFRWGSGKPQIEASLTQDFIRMLQIPRRASAADNRLRAAAAEAVTVALDVTAELQERYANVQALDALTPLLEEQLRFAAQLADGARSRLDAGEGTRGAVTTLEAARVEVEVEIDAARIKRREERLRLARIIGEPSSGATWTLAPWPSAAITAGTESQWVQTALAHRPEIQAAKWQVAALGDDYALLRLQPSEDADAGVEAEREDDWFVGPSASLPIPILDMGQARRARVSAEQIGARHALTLATRSVVEEVRVAYQALVLTRANLDRIRNKLIPLQQVRRQVTKDVYRVERDITPLLLAEQDLRIAQARAIDVERQMTIAVVRLERAVGGASVMVRNNLEHISK